MLEEVKRLQEAYNMGRKVGRMEKDIEAMMIPEFIDGATAELEHYKKRFTDLLNYVGSVAKPDAIITAEAEVIRAAYAVVSADTYVHPMLSRADAVKAAVQQLHDAVNALHSLQPPSQVAS